MRTILFYLLGFALAGSVVAQPAGDAHPVSLSQIETAIKQAEEDPGLAEESKQSLRETYRSVEEYIKNTETYREQTRSFKQSRENAGPEAKKLRASIEKRNAKVEQKPVGPRKGSDLATVDQQVQRDKAELAALVAKLEGISNRLNQEVERPVEVRKRLTELKTQQDEVSGQLQALPPAGQDDTGARANRWLLQSREHMIRAEIAMLDEELLSQPMRVELLKAQQEDGALDRRQLEATINAFELYAIELHKGATEEAATAARTAEEEAADKHPLVLKLAQENTELSDKATYIAGELESVKAQEAIADEQAQRFETDLKAVMQKLQIIGMSQALGQILRDQQARLPTSQYSSSDARRREREIAESSLRQLEYEEERHQLSNIDSYVDNLLTELDESERNEVRADVVKLAQARKDLVKGALEVESAYLRELGDLDFAERRLRLASEAYGEFINQRLLWIRTTEPLSLKTFAGVPVEIAEVLSPSAWWQLLVTVASHLVSSPIYLPMVLVFFALTWGQPQFRQRLRSSADNVGNYRKDQFSDTFLALGYTLLLALHWPLLLWVLGFIVGNSAGDLKLGQMVGYGLSQISYYYFGIEVLRQVLRQDGVAHRHFRWPVERCQRLSALLGALQQVFLPAVFFGVLSSRLHAVEGGSGLSMLLIIVALLSVARFFYQMPGFLRGRFDEVFRVKHKPRNAPFWGRLLRFVLVAIPLALIVCMLLGYGNTAIAFLRLLILTNGLLAGLLILQELGTRWFMLVRRRMVAREREQEREARAQQQDGDEIFEEDFGELETETLDEEGRKLLQTLVTIVAVVGIVGIWSDVLPALGILDSVELWQRDAMVEGQQTLVPVTLADLGLALLMALVGMVIVRRVPNVLEILLRQKLAVSHGTVYAATTLFRYTLIGVIVVLVLGSLGGSWGQIQWAVAALSVGIGFGLQEIVANFISGLILLFEQPIRVGDTVTVGETSGVVTRIRMRATTIRDWNRRELLVPNKEFITGRLLNWTLSDQLSRFEVVIGVAYGSDLRRSMELALEAANSHPDVMSDPEPFITFDEFGDNSLKLVLRCFMDNVDRRLTTSSAVRMEIDRRFNEEGIVIAFPQRDVHLDASQPLDINVRNI